MQPHCKVIPKSPTRVSPQSIEEKHQSILLVLHLILRKICFFPALKHKKLLRQSTRALTTALQKYFCSSSLSNNIEARVAFISEKLEKRIVTHCNQPQDTIPQTENFLTKSIALEKKGKMFLRPNLRLHSLSFFTHSRPQKKLLKINISNNGH